MATTLVRRWAGHVYGTNTGNLYADFDSEDGVVTGTIRLMDLAFGLTVFSVTGTFDGTLRVRGDPAQVPQGVQAGALEVTAVLTPEGNLRGEWKTAIGTAGTFVAYPHDVPEAGEATQAVGSVPEQLYMSTARIGALRLFGTDVLSLIQFLRKDFLVGRVVVTYKIRGNEVSKYADEFGRELSALGDLRYLKITVQEPEAHGINKAVIVELNAEGQNEVRTQGIHESWVVGKAEAVSRMLKESERFLVTTYKKFGLGLNQIIFLATLVLIPEIASIEYRAGFVVVVVALLAGLLWLHSRYIPNMIVYAKAEPTFLEKALPSVMSWLAAVAASLAAAMVFYWITGKAS